MANKSRATFAKRQREIARQERARDKSARRVVRGESKVKVARHGADPDIEGIVPGPQPLPYDLTEEELQRMEEEASSEEEEQS